MEAWQVGLSVLMELREVSILPLENIAGDCSENGI